MSFPRYPSYKDSGVEWLGEVPEHWEVKRLRFVAELNPSKSEISHLARDAAVSFLPMEAIGDDGTLNLDREKTISEVENGYTYFRDGDVTVAKITPCYENGKGALMKDLINGIGFGTTELIVARPRLEETIGTYLHYLFISPDFRGIGESHMYGAGGQKRVPDAFVRNFATAFPPVTEQNQIATFLDRETAKIDELVAEQQRLMELLKEKRQAVISHAVTKGLNLDAPMKPSGIEWLGDVPTHWNITRLGWICSEINDINHVMPVAVEHGVPFLSAKDLLDDGTLNFTNDIKMISEEDFANLSKKICPRRGDIIYSRIGACLGKARLVETDERFLVSYSCCVVRVIDTIGSRRFIQHLLDGEMILTEARMRTQGIGVPDLGLGEIGRFPVPLPPMREQEQIADFLDDHAGRFDTLTAEAQRAIDLLQERRTALISAAVTGQIDVRQFA